MDAIAHHKSIKAARNGDVLMCREPTTCIHTEGGTITLPIGAKLYVDVCFGTIMGLTVIDGRACQVSVLPDEWHKLEKS